MFASPGDLNLLTQLRGIIARTRTLLAEPVYYLVTFNIYSTHHEPPYTVLRELCSGCDQKIRNLSLHYKLPERKSEKKNISFEVSILVEPYKLNLILNTVSFTPFKKDCMESLNIAKSFSP